MKNNKGFTLIEVLVAFSIIFMIATTLVPIATTLNTELEVLSQRRMLTNRLHDELQDYLWDSEPAIPKTYTERINKKEVLFHFNLENRLIKGCAEWQNVKQSIEKYCLYGYPQE
ncbi:type II secretion system protein [Virgibacillus oceani]|uniref:Uncharacterized protein n=1 Tax=Virgibacillus oceani TaxID=1479511 RepID=A0A917H0N3_9BACI|nr:type II secretion system protein [Virgibacillus oceani]GGG63754.1 hypothetical protein GCM10011398_03990 [Virgibacillus oceani]